jgi:ABC-type antimicrobial peptide transport system permease subunit
MIIKQGLRLTLLGLGIGLAASLVVTRWMASLLYGVSATDTLTFVVVCAVLAGVAILAGFLPARRASRVDPIRALRHQ